MSLLHSVVYCEENVIVWGGRERLDAGGGWGAVGRSVGRSVVAHLGAEQQTGQSGPCLGFLF